MIITVGSFFLYYCTISLFPKWFIFTIRVSYEGAVFLTLHNKMHFFVSRAFIFDFFPRRLLGSHLLYEKSSLFSCVVQAKQVFFLPFFSFSTQIISLKILLV